MMLPHSTLSPHVWRNIQIVAERRRRVPLQELSDQFGISKSRVSQVAYAAERYARLSVAALAKFKEQECERGILAAKREYDALPPRQQQRVKPRIAARIDMLLSHYREAHKS